MNTCLNALAALCIAISLLIIPGMARADPADIDAAARGVVRVVIIDTDDSQKLLLSHGSGFAVSANRIVTNAHVIRAVLRDRSLRIGIVPPEGDDASLAKLIDYSPKNDLALLEITEGLRLPPLVIAGSLDQENTAVIAVGYPGNVDMAQGLRMRDYFNAQPPVKSRGFLSGMRPARQFDTVLHTAPIAGGNSGGPLLDTCGKVIGINSFGAMASASDAEFFFAISARELLPFLRKNNISPQVNGLPCRSLEEVEVEENRRTQLQQAQARSAMEAKASAEREKRARIRQISTLEVQTERENVMAIAALCLLIGSLAAFIAFQASQAEDGEKRMMVAGTIAAFALVASLALWFTRPGLDAIDHRVNAALADASPSSDSSSGASSGPSSGPNPGTLLCRLQTERSRITSMPEQEITFDWNDEGCLNGRTQYGFASGSWSRILVPSEEDAVSVNRFDPETQIFTVDRYLLRRSVMDKARTERGTYSPPGCTSSDAASKLGDMQGAVLELLPDRPNERLVYSCQAKGN